MSISPAIILVSTLPVYVNNFLSLVAIDLEPNLDKIRFNRGAWSNFRPYLIEEWV